MKRDFLTTWFDRRESLCVVDIPLVDEPYVLGDLYERVSGEALRYWSPGCRDWLSVERHDGKVQRLGSVDGDALAIETCDRALDSILDLAISGAATVFVVRGLFAAGLTPQLEYQLERLHWSLRGTQSRAIFLDERPEVPISLHPLLPQFPYLLPSRSEVSDRVTAFFAQADGNHPVTSDWQRPVVQASVGLPRAEIDIVLERHGNEANPEQLARKILDYKQAKLSGRGITILPEPDVPVAAGMDRLDRTLDRIGLLMTPEAERRKLKPPKAVLLWGIPGTGKSLAAKLAAQRIGGTLVASDWNGLMGKNVRESLSNLDYLLDFLKRIGTSVLLFDEFEKAFMGWDESGHLGKLAARLLSWMNDHEEPCVMFATINHLQLLPPEMIRRFEIVHFFGMPHNGALQKIFAVHLDKYFDYEFSLDEWHYLLREYRGCTPAEVMKAVKRTANRRFFRDMQDGKAIDDRQPTLTLAELIEERETFVPDASKRDVSDMLAGILNRADYAEPVQGEDTSIYAEPPHQLLGIDEANLRKSVNELQRSPVPQPLITRPRPAIEDI